MFVNADDDHVTCCNKPLSTLLDTHFPFSVGVEFFFVTSARFRKTVSFEGQGSAAWTDNSWSHSIVRRISLKIHFHSPMHLQFLLQAICLVVLVEDYRVISKKKPEFQKLQIKVEKSLTGNWLSVLVEFVSSPFFISSATTNRDSCQEFTGFRSPGGLWLVRQRTYITSVQNIYNHRL
jgi:hypothetical protein